MPINKDEKEYQKQFRLAEERQSLADRLASNQGQNNPESQWKDRLNGVVDKILNREKFSYDLNGDALYQQYKDQFTRQGKMAMMDTMGQAAALTGGYGSTYAQQAGQQAYQGYLQGLNDKIPELYQLALDTYNREGDDLLTQYSLLSDRENQEYSRGRDAVADQQWQQSFDYQKGRDAVSDNQWQQSFEYQKGRDEVADGQWERSFAASEDQRATENEQWERSFGYQQERDAVSDNQWQQEFDTSNNQWQQSFEYQKGRDATADEQWQQEFDAANNQWQQSFNYQKEQDQAEDNTGGTGPVVSDDDNVTGATGNAAASSITGMTASQAAGRGITEKEYASWIAEGILSGKTPTREEQEVWDNFAGTDKTKAFVSEHMTLSEARSIGIPESSYKSQAEQWLNGSEAEDLSPAELLWLAQYYEVEL